MIRTEQKAVLAALVFFLLMSAAACRQGGGLQEDTKRAEYIEEPKVSLYIADTQEKKELAIEEYLLGVVAGEMKPDWPKAAYAAQAILARSFTMYQLTSGEKSKYGTDLSTDVEEAQAYNPEAISDAIRAAVKDTRGQVMLYNGEYVKGWFHSYSGGKTATAKEGLNYPEAEPPYVMSVDLPDNSYAPADVTDWSVSFSEAKVKEALRQVGQEVGAVQGVKVAKRGPSGRATVLNFTGSNGTQEVSAPEFRIAIGANDLRSTLLKSLSWENGTLKAAGTGFGHGVGLSQWDAYMFARNGDSAEEIVKRFFKDVEVAQKWK